MTYRVEFTSAAARQVKKLPHPVRRRVLTAVAELADDPRPHGSRKLVGEQSAWRIRIGDYRVIYDVVDDTLAVTVVRARRPPPRGPRPVRTVRHRTMATEKWSRHPKTVRAGPGDG
ncbi:MAG: type II toxin-antitoxin system RelE family toxin [Dermatophilaceae bacterium]